MLMTEVMDRVRVLLRWVDAVQRVHPEQLMNGDERAAYVLLTNEVRTFQYRSPPMANPLVPNTPAPDRKQISDKLTAALRQLGMKMDNHSPEEQPVWNALALLEEAVCASHLARQRAAGPKSAVQEAAEGEFKKAGLGPQA